MTALKSMDAAARAALADKLKSRYEAFQTRKLNLDMTRGKPCSAQLDLSADMLTCVDGKSCKADGAVDTRNYGGLGGLDEARKLFGDMLEVAPGEVIVHGNSSLTLMYDVAATALLFGVPGGDKPWRDVAGIKFLCPCPGYDRHFSICQHFGIQMVNVGMNGQGPDMDQVEKLVAADPAIKGMWCVPKYSNPTGETYSDAVVDRLARMKTAAPDFRIFWDNAYTVHHLGDHPDRLKDILKACKDAGHADRAYIFGSTSKISFAGGGVSMVGASESNIKALLKSMSMQCIGPDKINQLRHVRFFKSLDGIQVHMRKHAAILKPKFDAVVEVLSRELGDAGVAAWSNPNGGYFISLDTLPGCAKDVVAMAGAAGVKMTGAGATFPYGKDPQDCNIRISPSLPSVDEIRTAMELLAICVLRVSLGKNAAK